MPNTITLKNNTGNTYALAFENGSDTYALAQEKPLYTAPAFQDQRGRASIRAKLATGTFQIVDNGAALSSEDALAAFAQAERLFSQKINAAKQLANYDNVPWLIDSDATQDNIPDGTTYKRITQAEKASYDRLASSPLIFWYTGNPTVLGNSVPMTAPATFAGSALYEVVYEQVRLTSAVNGDFGHMYWENPGFSLPDTFCATWELYAGGGNGADGTSVYFGTDSTPGTLYSGDGVTKGIAVNAIEWTDELRIYVNGTLLHTRSGLSLLDNGAWQAYRLQVVKNKFLVLEMPNYNIQIRLILSNPIDLTGTIFGATSYTGGANNGHYIRRLSLVPYVFPHTGAAYG